MKRRKALAALAATAPLLAQLAYAQAVRRDGPARIATLDDAPAAIRASFWTTFRKRLAELGYVEGTNLVMESRFANGDLAKLDALAAELVALKPDVLAVVTTTVAIAAKKATSRIPIVAMGPADPVKSRLVASLGRPGGNLTGVSPNQAEIAGKWVDLLRELVPSAKSFAYLTDPANPGEMLVFDAVEARARTLGMSARALDGVTAAAVEHAFATIAQRRVDALVVATTASLLGQRQTIIEGAARARLPAIYARREYADAGGLLSYGTDGAAMPTRGAEYVDRILRGAKPAELPFEMAATFRLVLNLRAARALGLDIPQSVRVRADEVIE